ncbi:uncharacterized protein TrAtP1_000160 [Trichoderma atroviride]|uniref:uncharacterized protein n=1 Tax=Hypocrea atroviridis TaxID=63577 RepID=UPI00331D79C0|nr:hypothetical protein TrAtP1_000160 [Trichoderma atroviride]
MASKTCRLSSDQKAWGSPPAKISGRVPGRQGYRMHQKTGNWANEICIQAAADTRSPETAGNAVSSEC